MGAVLALSAANTTDNDNQLVSWGTTAYLGYLRFQLPAAPAGQRPRSARPGFRASSDPTAGSADNHRLVPVTGTWTESSVTYNSRPSGPGRVRRSRLPFGRTAGLHGHGLASTVRGTAAGASVSTGYSVETDAMAPGGAPGSANSSALTSDGADWLRIWSGGVATAAYRPQLVLTFGAE